MLVGLLAGQAGVPVDGSADPAPPEAAASSEDASRGTPSEAASESLATPNAALPTQPAAAAPGSTPPQTAGAVLPRPKLSSLPSGANVAIIPIEGLIYDFTFESLQRRVDKALQQGATVIVLEIDTYGGLVTTALDIAKYLKDPTEVPVPTIAWVNNKAYSAGILIASACDEIVMAPASATGDCAPIVPGQNLTPTERAKAFSPIALEFKNSAARNDYTYATFHAMCVLGIELYLIENPATGERRVVNQADYAVMVTGDESARAGILIRSEEAAYNTTPTLPGSSSQSPTASIAVYNMAEAEEAGSDLGNWVAVTVLPSGKSAPNGRIHSGVSLLFTADDVLATDIGLSKATLANDADLARYLGAASVSRINQTWSENFAAFLTQLWVRAILVVLLALGAYLELQAPGLGIPGAVAVLALLGLLGVPMIIGLADVWHILIFAGGLVLLVVDLSTAVTFGVLGIIGLIMMLAALVLSVVPSAGGVMPAPGMWDRMLAALLTMLVGFVISGVGFVVLFRYFGNLPGLSRLILTQTQIAGSGLAAPAPHLAGDSVLGSGTIAVGQTGTVVSSLRPAGEADLNGQIIDVTIVGSFLDVGSKVRVVKVTRFSIVVDAIEEN